MLPSRCPQGTHHSSTRRSRSCHINSHHFRDSRSHKTRILPQQRMTWSTVSLPSLNTSVYTDKLDSLTWAINSVSRVSSPLKLPSNTLSDTSKPPDNSSLSSSASRRLASCGVVVAALVLNTSQAAKAVATTPESQVTFALDLLFGSTSVSLSGTSPTASDGVRLGAESSAVAQLTNPSSPSSSVSTEAMLIPAASSRSSSTVSDMTPLSPSILAPPSPPPPTPTPGLLSPSVRRPTGKYYVETRAPQVRPDLCIPPHLHILAMHHSSRPPFHTPRSATQSSGLRSPPLLASPPSKSQLKMWFCTYQLTTQ